MTASRQMKLGAFSVGGGSPYRRLAPPQGACGRAGIDIDHYIQLARTAEAAKFDMIFCEDAAAACARPMSASPARTSRSIGFEPISLLSALAVQTQPHRPSSPRPRRATT